MLDQNALLAAIHASWTSAIPDVPFDVDATWRECGADSLRTLMFVLHLEQTLGRKIPLDQLHAHTTARSLARFLDSGRSAAGSGVKLHLVPGILGDEPLLATFRHSLLPDLDTVTVDLPDLDVPDRVLASVAKTAHALLPQIQTTPGQPLILVGYSFGGLVALELARQLGEAGQTIGLVCLIDSLLVYDRSFKSRMAMLMQHVAARPAAPEPFAPLLAGGGSTQTSRGVLYRLEQLLIGGLCRLQMIGIAKRLFPLFESSLPFERRTARRFQMLAALRYRAILRWHPPRYRGQVLLFASEDPRAQKSLDAWRQLCPELEITYVDGLHRDMLRGPSLQTIRSSLLSRVAAMKAQWDHDRFNPQPRLERQKALQT